MKRKNLSEFIETYKYVKDRDVLPPELLKITEQLVTAHAIDDYFLSKNKILKDDVRGLIEIPALVHQMQQEMLGPFELPNFGYGDAEFGTNQVGEPIKLPSSTLIGGHSTTVSRTGGGKTQKIINLVDATIDSLHGMWAFDTEKGGEFRYLNHHLRSSCSLKRFLVKVITVKAEELKLNPLQPEESVSPVDWAPKITDLIVKVLDVPPSASRSLQRIIIGLYQEFSVLDGQEDRYPTFFDLYLAIKGDQEIHGQSKAALLNSLGPILMSIGCVLRYRKGWMTKDLANRHIVFELNSIGETEKNLILNTLILREFTSRLAEASW